MAALWGNHLLTSAVLADHAVQASGGNATLFRSLTKTPQPLTAPNRMGKNMDPDQVSCVQALTDVRY